MWRQAKWDVEILTEIDSSTARGSGPEVPFTHQFKDIELEVPEELARKTEPNIPSLSELEVVRHFIRLSQMSFGVDAGMIPLGSCTMKYNPKILDALALNSEIEFLHPLQDEDTVQGLLEILYTTERWLAEIVGLDKCVFQPPAGSAGEFAGALIIRKYHLDRGELRDEMLIPDSAHGSNFASAAMAGFKVVKIPTRGDGCVDLDALKAIASNRTAGIMLTNPNTLGIFERDILEIAEAIHDIGGLLYYDGANLNGIMGIARPGDMGFDIVHLNLHKTFATPHGGGGPGGGVLCVRRDLIDYLPRPILVREGGKLRWDYSCGKCIGMVRAYHGNITSALRTFGYIAMLGPRGLREVAETTIINTNYFIKRVLEKPYYELPYSPEKPRKHEVVLSAKKILNDTGVSAEDISKRLLDHGVHAPTMYFPPIVDEALMIEFTESEPKREIDRFVEILHRIAEEAYRDPSKVKGSPTATSVGRLDLVKANHPKTLAPSTRYVRGEGEGGSR